MLGFETVMMQMKNNKSQRYNELTVDMRKAAGPIRTQWLFQVLWRIWTEHRIQEDSYK
jgi:hypothetical protein